MSNKWKWTLIVALFFSAGTAVEYLRTPSGGPVLARQSSAAADDRAHDAVATDTDAGPQSAPIVAEPQTVADDDPPRMYRSEVARHHLINPVVRLECESPDDRFDCRLKIVNDHPYYDGARFDSQTLKTLAANYDPVAALVLAQRFSFQPDERTRRFVEAATYSGRAGPLMIMVRDFENDPTDLAAMVNRCKYLYVATWMEYPFDDGSMLSRACENVAALGGDRQVVKKDAQTLYSHIQQRRRATVGTQVNGGSS